MSVNKVIKQIDKSQKILLLTHKNPDGDALGSMLGFAKILQQLDKKVKCYCCDSVPSVFLFLPETETIKSDFLLGDYDLVVILDCGDIKRTGFADRIKEFTRYKNRIINIDHHPKNDLHRIAKINLVDYSASSTSEIIYDLAKELKIKIDHQIATCLLTGLYTDTGAFRHSNTTPQILQMAAELLSQGARLKQITKNVTNGRKTVTLKLWGRVLSRIKINSRYKIVSSLISRQDLQECQATQEDLAGVINMINTIPNTKAAILLYELEKGKIKASLRTESDRVDVSRLASIFGGGGLKKASGFTIDGHLVADGNGGWKVE